MELKEKFVADFKTFEKALNGESQTATHEIRKKAIHTFEELGIPTTKLENWKYTNVSQLTKTDFNLEKSASADKTIAEIIPELKANRLVFLNGKYLENQSNIIDKNITIKSLKKAFKEDKAIVEEHFAKYANFQKEAFTALNTAYTIEGTFIHIPKGVNLAYPILVHYLSDGDHAIAIHPRNLLVAEENSTATMIEIFQSENTASAFTNTVSEIVVAKYANIDMYKVQIDNDKTFNIGSTYVDQQTESTYSNTVITLSGKLVRNNLRIALNGEHCEAYMNGLYIPMQSKQIIDNHTFVDHAMPNCYSNEYYKGVMDGKGTGVFNGKILVRQDAQQTNAFQSNKNILLSDDATINTKPELEIYADDVKCSHGATIGQLDKEALFYLRSRGMTEKGAKKLLTRAFAGDIIEKVKVEALQNFLNNKLDEVLG